MKQYDRQPIFKISVAQELLRRGFTIRDIKRDERNKEKTIFFFDKSPEFYQAWNDIRGDK